MFRAKDIWNWWSNAHYDRPGGTESGSPTAWMPQGKPIWFTELGCPAVDKGANQPNVFFDPKSSESALPYYSNGERDDLIQRRFLEAHLKFWSDAANNPASGVYSARDGGYRRHLSRGAGMRGRFRSFRRAAMSGAMRRITASAIG